jgi:hypothetical protein
MRFFKRGSSATSAERIAAFWDWWSEARHRVANGIEDGSIHDLVAEISDNVHAIDERLAWELSRGSTSQHALIVTPEGDLAARPAAVLWHEAAPPADETWEYHTSRQPGPLDTLEMDGVRVDLADYRSIAGWDESRERVDVKLWHPTLAQAAENLAMRAAFLFLDNLLGEDDVERWIGQIDVLDAPIEGRTPDELRAEVLRRASEATGEVWSLAERSDGRDTALVLANMALKPIDHPLASNHVLVAVDRGLDQLSGSGELPELDAAEDRLVDSMTEVGAIHLGHVTERRRRRIHFMAPDAERARQVATAWAAAERRFGPRVEVADDPRWEARRELGL